MSLDTKIPIFSLLNLQKGLHKQELQRCLMEKGVFYLTDSGVSEIEHKILRTATMDFFQTGSEEDKGSVTTNNPAIRRGFSKLEAESTAQVTDKGTYTDFSMCYSMGTSDNLFPSQEFEEVWTNYFNRLYRAGQDTARVVLNSIKPNHDGIESLLDCEPLLRFRYFPEVPESRCAEIEPLRMAPHYDVSIVTLLHQTPCPNNFVSLQCSIGNEFVDIPPIPNSMVVLCGAVASLVSVGKVKAPIHRVVAPTSDQRIGSSRTSSVFFLRPKSDFIVSIPLAKACGFDISLSGETAPFSEWVGGNYKNLHTKV